ncbi:MAG TPA: ExbD/TolR family protein [Gammaproteobacteria bacterium]|nr:ExbD/TolR family protein [Gammaproteobacteria bacterium]
MRQGKKNRRLMGHMNVVPYIDVMLVLLIIFMVTAPLLQQGITVDLPEVDAEPLDPSLMEDNEVLILSIDAEGSFYLNLGADPESPVADEDVLTTTAAVIRRNPETPIVLKSDQSVDFGRVAYGLALLQRAGATGIGILTDPVEAEAI